MAPPSENFNRTRAEGILQRWYGIFTNDGKNPIFSPSIDTSISGLTASQLGHMSGGVSFSAPERIWPRDYALLNQVERMIQSGYIEQDISDALSRVATSASQEYRDDDGIFGKRSWYDITDAGRGERASEYIARRLNNAFPDGRSDAELTEIYNKFADYLPENSADILKGFDYQTSDALNRHITNNKGWADDIILGEARKLLERNSDIDSELQLLAELSGMSTDNLPEAITALYLGFPQNEDGTNLTPQQRSEYIRNFSANNISEQTEMRDSIGVPVSAEAAEAEAEAEAAGVTGIPEQVPVPAEAPISVKNIVASGAGVYLGQDPTTNNYRVGIDDGRGGFTVQEVAPAGEFIVPDEAAGQTYTASLTPAAQGIGFAPTGEFPAAESPQPQTFAGLGIGDALSIWQMNANAENRRIQNEQNRIINQYNADAAEATAQYRGDVLRQNAELDKLNRRLQWDLNNTVSAGTQAQIDAANERWRTVSANTQAQLDQQQFQFENISATDAANLAERERAARASEAGATFRQRIATQPALEQQSLARMTRLDDLLSDGGNYLARAFAQYGMTPPTPQPTLADRVNETVRGEIIQANADKKAAYDEAVAGLIAAEYEKARDTAEQSAWDAYVAANTVAGTPYVPAQYDDASFQADLQARRAENRAILENEAIQNWAATLAGEGVPDFVTAGLEEAGEIDDFEKAAAALEAGNPYAGLRSYGEALPTREDSKYLLSEAQAATGGGFTGQSREDWRSGFTFDTQPEWAKGLTPTQREAFGLPSAPEYEAVPPETSMEALVGQARGFLSPAASDVYFGAAARPKTGIGFALPSYQQVQRLDPEQRDALNTALLTEFNIPLDVAMHEERLRGMGARTSAPAAFAARPTQMFRQTPFRTTPTGLRESTAAIPADRFTPRRRTTPVQPAMFRPA